MKFKLEICVDSVESAINAQLAGADRVEFCSSLPEGGTTPGAGAIAAARQNLDIGLHVIIRPRGGDFLYSRLEFEIMKKEIEICRQNNVDGIVIGILDREGNIDIERTRELVDFSRPMSVTFHRAFDMCSDPFRGLEDVIAAGAERLLTSGQENTAMKGSELIGKLVERSAGRIIIMPGSGITESNIAGLAEITGASEFHMTGRKIIDSEMIYRKTGIFMGGSPGVPEFSRLVADRDLIERIIRLLKLI